MKRLFLYILLLLPSLLLKATDYVAIVEILYDTPLNEDANINPHNYGEFVMLYNFGEEAVNVQGWSLKTISPSQSFVLPNIKISPQSCLMIAYGSPNAYHIVETFNDDYSDNWTDLHVLYFLDPDSCPIQYQTSIILPDDTCSIVLQDNHGITRDSVRYGPSSSCDTMIAENMDLPDDGSPNVCININVLNTVKRSWVQFTIDGITSFNASNWYSPSDPDAPKNFIKTGYEGNGSYSPSVSVNVQSPSIETNNYIVQVLPQVAMEVVPTLGLGENMLDAQIYVQRFDALGRPMQTIQKNATPSGKHLITYQEYDKYNRPTKKWLPVASDFSFLEFGSFRNTSQQFYPSETVAYEEQLYSSTVLEDNVFTNAAIGARKAGNDMGGRYAEYTRNTNEANRVKVFTSDSEGILHHTKYYEIRTLIKEQTKDEDGKRTSTYTDREGRVIMTSKGNNADTYYVYNSLGQLAYILPPLAADALGTGTYDDDNLVLKKYAYVYRYDERGNCVYKRLPGCEPTYMVYDAGRRLVKTQDGNQRARGHYWTVYKYDKFNRIVYTSEVLTGGSDLQDAIDSFKDWNVCETFSTTTQSYPMEDTGYSRGFYHNHPTKLLTVNYYDTYDFLSCLSATTSGELAYAQRDGYDEAITDPAKTKGRLTGTRTYNLKDNTYTITAYYYDLDGYLVQQRSTNRLGGTDNNYWDVDFRGKPLKLLTTHNTSTGIEVNEQYTYTYDHANRLVSTIYSHNNDAPMVLNSFQYDELGRMVSKKIYNAIDSIQYQYNIRDWVTQIKSSGFEENIYYNQPLAIPPTSSTYYNGNIAATTWTYQGETNGYMYFYDDKNRFNLSYSILDSTFGDYYYTESMTYDKSGNITSLNRWDEREIINYLRYTYDGNHVTKITDDGYYPVDYSCKRYMDLADEDVEMGYDANGNLIYDLDRQIVAIRYNILNLPDTIQFVNGSQIVHEYDALGNRYKTTYRTRKVAATVPVGTTLTVTDNVSEYDLLTHVMNGNMKYMAYDNEPLALDYVFNREGYMDYLGPVEHYPYYYIRDHLGNIRETYVTPSPGNKSCYQRMQYYPSGLPWNDNINPSMQPYKYNGKEFVEMHGLDEYDSEARWYYPAVMRTTTMDPLCEKYPGTSPYAWCENNPINLIDPDGRIVKPHGELELQMIQNTLPEESRDYVRLDENGFVDKDFLNTYSGESLNFNSLKTLVNSDRIIEVILDNQFTFCGSDGQMGNATMWYDSKLDEFPSSEVTINGLSTGEGGFMGKVLFPDREGIQNSPNENIIIIINKQLSPKGAAETYSHEANGHALLYILNGGNHKGASHQPVNGLWREGNKTLKDMIINSKIETIINMSNK